jgi:hypothetical protein
MSVIEGASVSVKTMSDGTLRLSIDIEPRNAQAAFALFGAPGRAVALAALVDGAGAVREPEPEKPKGGEWAKLAGMWCNDPDFWLWLNETFKLYVQIPLQAANVLRNHCEIESRAELDSDPAALKRFNDRIRHPFMKWMQARGITK